MKNQRKNRFARIALCLAGFAFVLYSCSKDNATLDDSSKKQNSVATIDPYAIAKEKYLYDFENMTLDKSSLFSFNVTPDCQSTNQFTTTSYILTLDSLGLDSMDFYVELDQDNKIVFLGAAQRDLKPSFTDHDIFLTSRDSVFMDSLVSLSNGGPFKDREACMLACAKTQSGCLSTAVDEDGMDRCDDGYARCKRFCKLDFWLEIIPGVRIGR